MNFRIFQKILFLKLFFFCFVSHSSVFGTNNIRPLTENSPHYSLGRSTAIAVMNTLWIANLDGSKMLEASVLDQFCSDELFYNEPSLSYACTGFLVAPDLLVTAGHCVYAVNSPNQTILNESGLACAAFDWVFDYENTTDVKQASQKVSTKNVYHCKRILYALQQETAPFADFAVIQLDRPVMDRLPLKMSSKQVLPSSEVFMIGHPFGTPKKISDHGQVVRNDLNHSSLITTLDAFEGNSGSPVFNEQNEIVGILVGGTPSSDTYTDKKNKCERVNRCQDDATNCVWTDQNFSIFPGFQTVGSEVQRISSVMEWIQKNQNEKRQGE